MFLKVVVGVMLLCMIAAVQTRSDLPAPIVSETQKFEKILASVDQAFETKRQKIRENYVVKLKEIRQRELDAGRLDNAQAILAIEKDVQSLSNTAILDNREKLRKVLSRTNWVATDPSGHVWSFNSDGTIGTSGNTWTAISGNQVAICFQNGAVDVLVFDETRGSFRYFEGPRGDATSKTWAKRQR